MSRWLCGVARFPRKKHCKVCYATHCDSMYCYKDTHGYRLTLQTGRRVVAPCDETGMS